MKACTFRTACVLVACLCSFAARAFVLEDSSGQVHRLSDYKGRWVLVNVWATWCAPCLQEIPELVALAESRRDIQLIGLAIEWQDRVQVLQFAEGMFVNYPIVLGRREDAQAIGKMSGLPTSFIFDPEGRLAASHTGALTRRQVDRLMDSRERRSAVIHHEGTRTPGNPETRISSCSLVPSCLGGEIPSLKFSLYWERSAPRAVTR